MDAIPGESKKNNKTSSIRKPDQQNVEYLSLQDSTKVRTSSKTGQPLNVAPTTEKHVGKNMSLIASKFLHHRTKLKKKQHLPGDSKWPFDSPVGGHKQPMKRVTFSPSQKGHQQNCQVFDIKRMSPENFVQRYFYWPSPSPCLAAYHP